MNARLVRTPHPEPGVHVNKDTWWSFCRGQVISRREAFFILINGPRRARVETEQANNSEFWKVEDGEPYLPEL